MKKYLLIMLAAILLVTIGLLYCSYQVKEKTVGNEKQSNIERVDGKDAREIVWGQLSAKQKDEIVGTWKDGRISKITLSENSMISAAGGKSYIGKEVYYISFPSKNVALLGDVIIYADVNTADIIGYGLRD